MSPFVSDVLHDCAQEVKPFSRPLMRNLSRGFENSIEKDSAAIEKMERTMDQEEMRTTIREEERIFIQNEVVNKREIIFCSTRPGRLSNTHLCSLRIQ